jgi:hypothetical protein
MAKREPELEAVSEHGGQEMAKREPELEAPWTCLDYGAYPDLRLDDEWCQKVGTFAGYEVRLETPASGALCDGCWCCKRSQVASLPAESSIDAPE